MNEEEIRELFAEMRDEPVPVESLVRVRVLVDERIRRRASWRMASLVAFAALVVAAFVIQMRPMARKSASPPVAVQMRPETQPPAEASPHDLPLTVGPAIERKVLKPRRASPRQVASIRIETPDPDVVILLVGE